MFIYIHKYLSAETRLQKAEQEMQNATARQRPTIHGNPKHKQPPDDEKSDKMIVIFPILCTEATTRINFLCAVN